MKAGLMFTVLLSGMVFGRSMRAQNADSIRCNVYEAYISGDMELWERNLRKMEQGYHANKNNAVLKQLLFAQYGYIGYKLGAGHNTMARRVLEKAQDNLDRLMAEFPSDAKLLALKGAFFGYEIELNKTKAIYLGPKSMYYIDKAIETDRNNPTGWLEKGNAKYYMPKHLGRDVAAAISMYRKAIALFEKEEESMACNWLYLNTLATLGKMYASNNQPAMAGDVYRKALRREPRFEWIKNELLPELQ